MAAYRAAIYRAETGDETRLTGPDHAHLSAEDMIEQAIREAKAADLIGDEWPRIPESALRARLYVREWVE